MLLTLEKIQKLFPDGKLDHRKVNWVTVCPECNFREFSISLSDNHLCGCFRKKQCGWTGNIYTLLKKIGRLDFLLNKELNFQKIEKVKLYREDPELNLELPSVRPPIGWKRTLDDEYLNSRNFDQYDRYKVGFTNIDPRLKKDYVIFLIEEDGDVKGYVSRNKKPKKEIDRLNDLYKSKGENKRILRYINSSTDFAKLVYGLDEITVNTKIIIIVEGIFDKFNIDRLLNLHNQEEIKCICTFKCAVSKEQIFKIQQKGENIETAILLYDPDVIDKIKQVGFELREYFPDVLIGMGEGDKDAGDFDDSDIEKVFNSLQSPTQFSINKLSHKLLKN